MSTKEELLKQISNLRNQIIQEFNAYVDEMVNKYGERKYEERDLFLPEEYHYYFNTMKLTDFIETDLRYKYNVENLITLVDYLKKQQKQIREAIHRKKQKLNHEVLK